MDIYLSSLILIIFVGIFFKKKNQAIICSIILFLISGFRSIYVGMDLISYIPFFERSSKITLSEMFKYGYEIGYSIFNKIISIISNKNEIFILTTSGFIIFYLYKFIKKESKLPWLSFYLFVSMMFFGSTLNLIRQSMAMVILLQSLKYVKNKKVIQFILTVLLASTFHRTAIIFLIVYFISRYKINIKYLFYVSFISIIVFLNSDIIVSLGRKFSNRYIQYNELNSALDGINMLILLIAIFILGRIFNKDREESYLGEHLIILAIVFQVIALRFSLFSRVVNYFSIYLIIFIPNIIQSRNEIEIRYIAKILVCLFTMVFYLYISKYDLNGILPYTFFYKNL